MEEIAVISKEDFKGGFKKFKFENVSEFFLQKRETFEFFITLFI